MRILLLSLLLTVVAQAEEPTPQSVLANRAGLSELKKTNPAAAQDKFIQGLARTPFEAKLHLNLGLTFELLGQNDKAQSSYETALKLAQDDEVRFAANFNLGEIQQKEKKKEAALEYYQRALKLNPDSLETKVNIELLTQSEQGGGQGKKDEKDQGKKEGQDKNNQNDKKGEDQNDDQKQDPKDKDKGKDKDNESDKSDKGDQKKKYGQGQPQKFKSEDLNQGDVNKILGEIKQQEQKIRADFNRREVKDKANDKDW